MRSDGFLDEEGDSKNPDHQQKNHTNCLRHIRFGFCAPIQLHPPERENSDYDMANPSADEMENALEYKMKHWICSSSEPFECFYGSDWLEA
jgi:hypothetical protein